MKKTLISLVILLVLSSSGALYAATLTDDVGPFPARGLFNFSDFDNLMNYFRQGSSTLSQFNFVDTPITGDITSATISGTIKGDFISAIFLMWCPVELWAGDVKVFDSKLQVLNPFSLASLQNWSQGWTLSWSFNVPLDLQTDLADGLVNFNIEGTPFFYGGIEIGLTTLSIENPLFSNGDAPLNGDLLVNGDLLGTFAPPTSTPEPATMLLLGSGLLGLWGARKKFRK